MNKKAHKDTALDFVKDSFDIIKSVVSEASDEAFGKFANAFHCKGIPNYVDPQEISDSIDGMIPFSSIIYNLTMFITGNSPLFRNLRTVRVGDLRHEIRFRERSEFDSIDIDIPSGYELLERKCQLDCFSLKNSWGIEVSESEPFYFEKKEIEKDSSIYTRYSLYLNSFIGSITNDISFQYLKFKSNDDEEKLALFSKIFGSTRSILLVKDPQGKEVERFWEKEQMWSHKFGYIVDSDNGPSFFLAMHF